MTVGAVGVSVTLSTGACTLTWVVAVIVADVAVIVAVPCERPAVNTPLALTETTFGFDDVHETRGTSVCPLGSVPVTASAVDAPACIVNGAGVIRSAVIFASGPS